MIEKIKNAPNSYFMLLIQLYTPIRKLRGIFSIFCVRTAVNNLLYGSSAKSKLPWVLERARRYSSSCIVRRWCYHNNIKLMRLRPSEAFGLGVGMTRR